MSTSYIKHLCDFDRVVERDLKNIFLNIGSGIINKEFIIIPENMEKVTNLLKYFTGNEGKYDINKGIYIFGAYGCGKTILIQTIRKFLASVFPFSGNGFQITSLEQIIETYKSEKSLDYFGYKKESTPVHLCINEFGKILEEKIYGTDANSIIDSLFMIRYELFQQGYLTHVTSNFHPKELNISPVIRDRLNEMFNFIEFKGDSFRK